MRSCATLSKFYERYMVEEGVDLVKELYCVESKKGSTNPWWNVSEISGGVTSSYWIQISTLKCGEGYLSQSEHGKNQRLRCQRIDSLPRVRILPCVREITWKSSRILSIYKTLGLFKKG